jgi:hypothetical protein
MDESNMKFVSLAEAADYVRKEIDPSITNENLRKISSRLGGLKPWPRSAESSYPPRYLYGIPENEEEKKSLLEVIPSNLDSMEAMHAGDDVKDPDLRYHSEVDHKEGMVIAYMPMLKDGFIRVPLSVDQRIHQLYSREGGNLQIAALAQSLQWRPFVLRGYLKARGLTHASYVWPDWEIEAQDVDDLAKDAFMAKAEKAKAKAETMEVERIRRDAEIGRNFRDLAAFIQGMGLESLPVIPVTTIWDSKFDVYFPMKDLHVGKYPHNAPSGYSLAQQEREIIERIDHALQKIVNTWGVPERFITVTGDDQLNSNSSNQTTLKGTSVGANSIGSFKEQALTLARIKQYQIEACLRYGARVYDHYIPSNHAPDAEFLIAEILKARFASYGSRVVFNTADTTMKVVAVGSVPLFDLHGTRIDDRNLPAAASRMCPPGLDFKKAVIFRGHTHTAKTMLQSMSHENMGITIHVVPSSAPPCAYEEGNLWDMSQHMMAAYRIDHNDGCDSTLMIR